MYRPTSEPRRTVSRRARIAALIAALAATSTLLTLRDRPARATSPITKVTVQIDGSMADWAPVLANPLQTTRDGDGSSTAITANCSAFSTDRDCPQAGGAGNDLETFAWTYDDDAVYLYIERFATGALNTPVDFFFVADVNHDGRVKGHLAQPGVTDDIIVHAHWMPNQGGSGTVDVQLADYLPADASLGDPIVCDSTLCGKAPLGYVDGYHLPGNNGAMRACPVGAPCSGASNADKLHAELKIPWAAFGAGVTRDTPFNWHVASANNGWLDQAVDNIGAPNGKLGSFIERGLSLGPDSSGASLPGGTKTYFHTLVNDGNETDFFNFSVTDAMGAKVELYDGSILLGVDDQGDGVWDAVFANSDGPADGRPDVTLAAGAAKEIEVVLTLPGRNGNDVTRITAESGGASTVTATATDSTYVGAPAFSPEHQDGWVVATETLRFREALLNGQGIADTFQLTAGGCAGYRVELARDAAGDVGEVVATQPAGSGTWNAITDGTVDTDGDPAHLPDLGATPSGGTKSFWFLVTPASGTPVGSTCALILTGHGDVTGATAVATHVVAVSGPVALTPDYLGTARARVASGASVFLPVLLRNASAAARAFSLASVQTPVTGALAPRVWSDPDGDGSPNDGALVTTSATLSPFGGSQHLLVELRAGSAAIAQTLHATTTATALDDSSVAASEIAEAIVGHVAVYRDELHTDGSDVFPPCATIYAEARGLTPGTTGTYRLDWMDPQGVVTDVPLVTMADGSAATSYAVPASAGRGHWQAVVAGAGLSEPAPFDVELAGTVTALSLDRARHFPGDDVTVAAAVRNDGRAALEGTSLEYSGAVARVRTGLLVRPGESVPDAFSFKLASDAAPGLHPLWLAWKLSCGSASVATRAASIAVAPGAPAIAAPASGALVASANPSVSGSGVSGASVTLVVSDAPDAQILSTTIEAGGTWTFVVPRALAQGSHTATAIQSVDGVPSDPSAGVTFSVDTLAPGAPTVTSPVDPTVAASAAIAISGTAPADATAVRLFVDGAGESGTVPVVGGAFATTLTLPDGAHALTARARDAAGNFSGDSAVVHVTIDTVPPAKPLFTSPAAGDAISGAVSVAGTAEAAPTMVEVTIDELPSGIGSMAVATRNGAGFIAPFDLLDGSYRATAVARDVAGNVSEPATVLFSIDTLAPAAPTVVAPAPGQVLDGSDAAEWVEVAGTAEPFSTITLHLEPGNVDTSATATAAGAWSARLVGLPDGANYTLTASARDAAGNVSGPTQLFFSLDTQAPFPPDVTTPALTVLGIAEVPGAQLTVGGTAGGDALGDATVDVTFAGTTHTVAATGGIWQTTFDVSALDPAGASTTLAVRARDVAGNVSGATTLLLTIDRSAPGLATLVGPPSPTNADGLVFTGSVPVDASAVALFDAAAVVTVVAVPGGGAFAFSIPAPGDGEHAYTARARDAARNEGPGTSPAIPVNVDRTPPGAASLGGPVSPTRADPLAFAATIPGDASALTLYDGEVLVTIAAGSGTFTFSVAAGEGPHAYTGRAVDAAGNDGPATPPLSITVDLTAPAAPSLGGPPSPLNADELAFWTTIPGDASAIALHEGATFVTTVSGSGTFSFVIPAPPDGTYAYTARAVDAAGNVGPPSPVVEITLDRSQPPQALLWGPVGPTNADPLVFTAAVPFVATGVILYEGVTLVTSVAGTGNVQIAIAAPSDGWHTYQARAVNAAGTEGPPSDPVAVLVDRTPPAAAPGLSGPPAATNADTLVFEAEIPGDAVALELYDGATFVATVTGAGTFTFTIPAPADGTHSYVAAALDAAGNRGPLSTSAVTVTVDRTPPATAPGLSGPPLLTNANLLAFEATVPGDASAIVLYDGATFVATVAGTGTFTFTLPAPMDGGHSYTARAADALGNLGPASPPLPVTVDRTAPAGEPALSGPPPLTNADSLTFTATIAGDAAGVELYDGATFVATVTGSGTFSFTIPVPADGPHSYGADAFDAAGNRGPVSSPRVDVTVDRTAPAAPDLSGPPPLTNADTLTFSATIGSDAIGVELYDGATFVATVSGSGTFSFAIPVPAEGPHSYAADAFDAAGNRGPTTSSPVAVTVDRTPPAIPSLAGPGPLTNAGALAFSGSVPADASAVELFDATALVTVVAVPGGGAFAFSVPAPADGAHTYTAKARDAAGNAGPPSPAVQVTVDRTPPAGAPGLSGPPPLTNADPLTFTATIGGDAAGIELYDGATFVATVSGSGTFSFAIPVPVDGPHSYTADGFDAAGNRGPVSTPPVDVTVDRTAPAAAPGLSGPPALTNADSLTFSATIGGDAIGIELHDGATFVATVSGSGTFSFAIPVPADGLHSYTADAFDAAGNRGPTTPSPVTVTVDRMPPGVPSLSGPARLTSADALAFSGFVPGEASAVELFDATALVTVVAVPGGGAFAFSVPAPADGEHTYTAKARDAAGNVGLASSAVQVTVDRTPPAAAPGLSGPPPLTNADTLTFTATIGSDAAGIELYDGATFVATVSGSGAFSFTIPVPGDGPHFYTAEAFDAARNCGQESTAVAVTVDRTAPSQPTIGQPADGAAFGPGTIHVKGTAEAGATVSVTVAGTTVTGVATGGSYDVAVNVPEGIQTIHVTASDEAGNVSVEAAITVTARTTSGDAGGGGCGCGQAGAGSGLLALLSLVAFAPRRRRAEVSRDL